MKSVIIRLFLLQMHHSTRKRDRKTHVSGLDFRVAP